MISTTRTPLICILLLSSAVTISAQTVGKETEMLREQLGVPPSVPITIADSPDLPNSDPLKVYIAAGFDMEVRKRTTKRVNDWNKKDAKKYGSLTIVTELTEADVILVQYSDRENPITRVGGSGGRVTSATFIPGTSYIIVPKGGAYEVLWRYQGKSLEHSRAVPGQTMRDHFFNMLKKRRSR